MQGLARVETNIIKDKRLKSRILILLFIQLQIYSVKIQL